jgi:integrase
MLGLLLGCGLRRSEVVGLSLEQLQSREGRWVIVNLVGKEKRLRTVPVPSWTKELLNVWLRHSGLCHGCGGELEQIQFLLGHASVQTTERYIGSKQKLQDAVHDRLGISVACDTA